MSYPEGYRPFHGENVHFSLAYAESTQTSETTHLTKGTDASCDNDNMLRPLGVLGYKLYNEPSHCPAPLQLVV